MKQKKWPVLDITDFFSRMNTQVKKEVRCPKAFTCVELIVTKWAIRFFLLNRTNSHICFETLEFFEITRCGVISHIACIDDAVNITFSPFYIILAIKNGCKCKTKIIESFTKIRTIILSVKIVLTLRVKLPCRKCKILSVREIVVLSFIITANKRMDDALTLRRENKRAIHH